jgi:ABC-type branched-subunit amino acid transport system ATPase component
VAVNNLASNYGEVDVKDLSIQVVAARNSGIVNYAGNGSTAVQNISTNNGCVTCYNNR